jgi:hypothetical protein
MKRFTRILMFLLLILGLFILGGITMAAEINLIKNASMELVHSSNPNMPSGWKTWKSTTATVDFGWSKDVAYDGKCSLALGEVGGIGSACWQTEVINVVKGKKYKASVYIKAEGITPGEEVSFSLYWWAFTPRAIIHRTSQKYELTGDTDWILLTVEGVAADDIDQVAVHFFRSSPAQGRIWIDKASLVQLD